MSAFVEIVAESVPIPCHASKCSKDGCSVTLESAPHPRVLIDLDCEELGLLKGTRCDYVFVGADSATVWVAPIELKSGTFKGNHARAQLQAGADIAAQWLPPGKNGFRLAPVLARGPQRVHRRDYMALRAVKIRLRAQRRQAIMIKCGQALRTALGKFPKSP